MGSIPTFVCSLSFSFSLSYLFKDSFGKVHPYFVNVATVGFVLLEQIFEHFLCGQYVLFVGTSSVHRSAFGDNSMGKHMVNVVVGF